MGKEVWATILSPLAPSDPQVFSHSLGENIPGSHYCTTLGTQPHPHPLNLELSGFPIDLTSAQA